MDFTVHPEKENYKHEESRYFIFSNLFASRACGEDDYVYPNVLTDMIDLKTDHTGTGRYLITDEGTEWRIQSRTGLDGLAPDTTYRTVTMYAPLTDSEEAEKEAILYNTQLVISPVPLPESKFKEIKTDPVAIQSIWRGGNYLNLILQVKVKDQKHGYHFIENKLENKDGEQTLYLTLYHDRNNDIEGFNRKVYLSVPLWHTPANCIKAIRLYSTSVLTKKV